MNQAKMVADVLKSWHQDDLTRCPIWVHGNGFIQVGLHENIQLQVWDDKLTLGQSVRTGIHNHRFDFEAHVMLGLLRNLTYIVESDFLGGEYWAYKVVKREGENTDLVPAGNMLYHVECDGDELMGAGESYRFKRGDFHADWGLGLTAVVQVKTDSLDCYQTRVMVPKNVTPDNDFSRYQRDPEELWPSVFRAVYG